MRRAEFILLTGVRADFFNSLARRDQLPFLRRLVQQRKGWGDYSPTLAFMTLLALALADAGGTQYEAGHFVDQEFERLFGGGLQASDLVDSQVYFGYATWGTSSYDAASSGYVGAFSRHPICGPLSNLPDSIEQLRSSIAGSGVENVVLINASQQLRTLCNRALESELGIDVVGVIAPRSGVDLP